MVIWFGIILFGGLLAPLTIAKILSIVFLFNLRLNLHTLVNALSICIWFKRPFKVVFIVPFHVNVRSNPFQFPFVVRCSFEMHCQSLFILRYASKCAFYVLVRLLVRFLFNFLLNWRFQFCVNVISTSELPLELLILLALFLWSNRWRKSTNVARSENKRSATLPGLLTRPSQEAKFKVEKPPWFYKVVCKKRHLKTQIHPLGKSNCTTPVHQLHLPGLAQALGMALVEGQSHGRRRSCS